MQNRPEWKEKEFRNPILVNSILWYRERMPLTLKKSFDPHVEFPVLR